MSSFFSLRMSPISLIMAATPANTCRQVTPTFSSLTRNLLVPFRSPDISTMKEKFTRRASYTQSRVLPGRQRDFLPAAKPSGHGIIVRVVVVEIKFVILLRYTHLELNCLLRCTFVTPSLHHIGTDLLNRVCSCFAGARFFFPSDLAPTHTHLWCWTCGRRPGGTCSLARPPTQWRRGQPASRGLARRGSWPWDREATFQPRSDRSSQFWRHLLPGYSVRTEDLLDAAVDGEVSDQHGLLGGLGDASPQGLKRSNIWISFLLLYTSLQKNLQRCNCNRHEAAFTSPLWKVLVS